MHHSLNQFLIVICLISVGIGTQSCYSSSRTSTYSVEGSVSGHTGTVTLEDTRGEPYSVGVDESSFSYTYDDDTEYSITVATAPDDQVCTVENGSGTLNGADVTNIEITCSTAAPKVFITAATTTGSIGGVTEADSFCMDDANYPGTGTYKALLVDGTNRVACTTADCSGGVSENVDWVFYAEREYFQDDGTTSIGTTNESGIFEFPLSAVFGDGNQAWTGLDTDWTGSDLYCASGVNTFWDSDAGGDSGTKGDISSTTETSISTGLEPCSFDFPLICVQQ